MALYREGKAAMAADGTVTGTGTKWQSSLSLIRPGATIMFLSSPIQMAVVNKVVSDTEIKAITTNGAVVASSDYAILLSDSLTVDGLAQDVAETLRYYQSQETVIADAVEFFKTFDFESLQNLANQIKADSEAAGASATAAAASESKAKTSEDNAKSSENAAKTSEVAAETARDQIQQIINDAGERSTLVVLAQPDGSKNIGRCSSVAALRNIEPSTNGQRINLASYYDDGTANGGGEFYYDSSDTTSADNGGTIIVTAGGKRWVRVLNNARSWTLDMFGVQPGDDLSANLPGIMTSLIALGGGSIEFRANASYVLSSTITIDIGYVQLFGRGATVTCNNAANTYALEITSSTPTPYGSPLRNRLVSSTGIELIGNAYTNDAVILKGNGTKKPAQFSINNWVIRGFRRAVTPQQNAYMFEFDHCTISRNLYNIYVPSDVGDSGERMTWINCDFTSNQYTEGDTSTRSYGMYSRAAVSLRFINCSFDWQWCLMNVLNTQAFFENCHLESPSSNYITTPSDDYSYMVLNGTSKVYLHNCFVLLNYESGGVSSKMHESVAYLGDARSRLSVTSSFVHVFGTSWWGRGPGLVNIQDVSSYNEYSPILGRSNSAANSQIVNGHFSQNTLTPSAIGWTSSFTYSGAADDLTYSTDYVYGGSAYSLKMYNQYAGVTSTHAVTVPYEGGQYYVGFLAAYAAVAGIISSVRRVFLDEYGNTVYTDLDNTMFGTANAWGTRRRTLDFQSLSVAHKRIKKVRIEIITNTGNLTPFYIGRVISQSY